MPATQAGEQAAQTPPDGIHRRGGRGRCVNGLHAGSAIELAVIRLEQLDNASATQAVELDEEPVVLDRSMLGDLPDTHSGSQAGRLVSFSLAAQVVARHRQLARGVQAVADHLTVS